MGKDGSVLCGHMLCFEFQLKTVRSIGKLAFES